MTNINEMTDAQKEVDRNRAFAFPSFTEQLDMLWHDIHANETLKAQLPTFYNAIKAVKDAHPKVE